MSLQTRRDEMRRAAQLVKTWSVEVYSCSKSSSHRSHHGDAGDVDQEKKELCGLFHTVSTNLIQMLD
ncbi:hypothetical protein KOW79_015115 [Hemibagrus wyckioides]|uniref:Uncharacterized protein n=1 Tax=Hemibagrus wyckioides TaxID=337641 RepID=A0A9D3NGQ2_9TELE|nr:hypothetical protein KOW79_015115 [Hemibagrus wyckioides]